MQLSRQLKPASSVLQTIAQQICPCAHRRMISIEIATVSLFPRTEPIIIILFEFVWNLQSSYRKKRWCHDVCQWLNMCIQYIRLPQMYQWTVPMHNFSFSEWHCVAKCLWIGKHIGNMLVISSSGFSTLSARCRWNAVCISRHKWSLYEIKYPHTRIPAYSTANTNVAPLHTKRILLFVSSSYLRPLFSTIAFARTHKTTIKNNTNSFHANFVAVVVVILLVESGAQRERRHEDVM